MTMNRLATLSILILAAMGTACASRPDEQLGQAQKAMDEARQELAEILAPGDWKSAQDIWNDAQAKLKSEKYAEAASLLLRAKSRFEKARDIARSKGGDMRREIDEMRARFDKRLGDIKSGMDSPKVPAAVKKKLEEARKEMDATIAKLQAELEARKYADAKNTATEALRQVFEAEKELRKAVK